MKPTTAEMIKEKTLKNDATVGALLHIITAICAFLFSLARVKSLWLPFGAAFVGGAKKKYLAASLAGAALGYITNISSGGFAYIACSFAIITVRLVLGDIRLTRQPLFLSLLTFFALLVTKLAVIYGYGGSIIGVIGEAALAGVGAYFLAIVFNICSATSSGTDIRETAALIFSASVFLLAVAEFKIIGLSLGGILAVTLILAAARFGMSSYGAVCGAVVGFVMSINMGQLSSAGMVYAFCGLMSGLFSALGSLGMIIAYIGTTLVTCLIIGNQTIVGPLFFEAVIGCGLFLIIPKKTAGFIGGLLSPTTEISRLDSVKGALIMRLEFASGALRDIYETVEDVAAKLKKINCPDFDKTLNKIEDDVCGGCSLRRHCWETAKEITAADALATWNRIKSPQAEDTEPTEFRCIRRGRFEKAIKAHCADYDSMRAAESRLSEVRGVISDQFEGVAKMLGDLSEEFKYEVRHDQRATENIILAFKNMGFHAVRCIAAQDKWGRLSADIHIKGAADRVINKMDVVRHLSLALSRDMDTPTVNVGGDDAFIFITEKPNYKVEIGLTQIPEEKGKLCGDTAKYFADGRGRFMMVLSDGMGTGGRAAVDSAMVSGLFSRMLKSGFGYDCSLKIINSSMIFKSTDESLATVDIAAIDLFDGECELLKAGAAPTFVKRGSKVGKAESRSLPPGILRNITFDKATLSLKPEDIVVMVSDGATAEDTGWITDILKKWTIGSAQQLADEIALAARRRRKDGHSDDITALVAILKK
ncbi:MAG: SpoIIE family protein phosphatase [Clostridia bacterium]|nr:SpoIIE family protein phosphatase [Clostridia bacterium]